DDDIQPVASGTQGHCLPIKRRMLHRLLQQLGRNVDLHRVLESLRDPSSQPGDATEDVHRSTLDTVFAEKGNVFVLDLQGHWNQHRVVGNLYEISAHLKRHEVDIDLVADDFLKILELNFGRRIDLGHQFHVVELLAVVYLLAKSSIGGERPLGNSLRL